MRITQLTIKGSNLKELSELLEGKLPYCHVNMYSDLIHILVNEKHYIRSDGLILTTVILNYSEDQKAQIQIIVGGGGSGLFNLDWNVEKHRTKEIIDFLKGFCKLEDWQLKIQKEEIIEEFEE